MPRSDVGCAIPDPTLQSALMASPAEARLPLSPFRQHRVPPAPTPRPPPTHTSGCFRLESGGAGDWPLPANQRAGCASACASIRTLGHRDRACPSADDSQTAGTGSQGR